MAFVSTLGSVEFKRGDAAMLELSFTRGAAADGLIWDGGEAYPSFAWLRPIGIGFEEVFRLEGDPEMAVSKGFKAHYSSDGQATPPVAAVDWLRIHYGFTADYENGSWLAAFRYAAGGSDVGNSAAFKRHAAGPASPAIKAPARGQRRSAPLQLGAFGQTRAGCQM